MPITEPIKTKGANLTNKNSNPCSRVPTIANSGLLKSQVKYSLFIVARAINTTAIITHTKTSE